MGEPMRLAKLSVLCIGFFSLSAYAASGVPLEESEIDRDNINSLQRGARNFMNYCSGCHSAKYVRYKTIGKDLDLSETQLIDNLMFNAEKTFETINIAMRPEDAERWFGVEPPDMSLIARSKGADYIFTFLKSFYVDPSSPTGVDNRVLAGTSMPHVLWQLQGEREYEVVAHADKAGNVSVERNWKQRTPGTQSAVAYDRTVRDLVNFLVYVGEPSAQSRKSIGIVVLFVLGVLFVLAYAMKKAFWKDIR